MMNAVLHGLEIVVTLSYMYIVVLILITFALANNDRI